MLLPYLNKDVVEAGCDEAGRGCLAGAVFAAAVILPKDFQNELLNDSKQLTERQRYALREVIEREAVAWAVGTVSPADSLFFNFFKFFLPAFVSCSHHTLRSPLLLPERLPRNRGKCISERLHYEPFSALSALPDTLVFSDSAR